MIKIQSHREQLQHLMDQCFSWSDNYGRLLAAKGFETMEVVANATPMQKAWAVENNLSSSLSSEEIIMAQIAFFKPEIIYFQDSVTFNGSFIRNLKNRFSFIKVCIGNICAPFTSSQIESFKAFDYFTVCSPFFQQQLRQFGITSVVIPHAFDQRILEKTEKENDWPVVPFIFTGSIIPGDGFHSIRTRVLEQLVQESIPFAFYGNLPDKNRTAIVKKQASYIAASILDNIGLKSLTDYITPIRKGRNHSSFPRQLKLTSKLYKMAKPPLFGLEMFKALSKAEIGFNIHGDCAGDYAANMRLFETTGVGTCLLTDHKSDLKNYFVPDSEIVTYQSAEECVEKVKWLIDHPDKLKEIAKRGQQRTLTEHHFNNRVDLFYDELVKHL
ncbi:glycosyltransferase family protein [Natronoflexus pectinivorans]|uniref:Glycosyl transferase family 1 n=1 Tax=Natronoflexus pectinivorans TaxID=682526 RepID=A0A4R2GPN5_9BACT|nr:glycosyltransferase [Natronoflexus pectinivorans]TCO11018.1 glycosyl transferase family 1 [Natronoflexus pectinivorans]